MASSRVCVHIRRGIPSSFCIGWNMKVCSWRERHDGSRFNTCLPQPDSKRALHQWKQLPPRLQTAISTQPSSNWEPAYFNARQRHGDSLLSTLLPPESGRFTLSSPPSPKLSPLFALTRRSETYRAQNAFTLTDSTLGSVSRLQRGSAATL